MLHHKVLSDKAHPRRWVIIQQYKCRVNNFTCRASRFETAIAPTYGRLSITASAKSEMKVDSHPSAGTRPHFSIPDFRANSLYSTSISSNVSICSLTKLNQLKMQIKFKKKNVRAFCNKMK